MELQYGVGVELERGEAIQVWEHIGARRVQRWRWGHASSSDLAEVAVGVLPDGRWFVERSQKARAYSGEQLARVVAGNLMARRDGWREIPAELGPDGKPTQPGWVRRGGEWFRESD